MWVLFIKFLGENDFGKSDFMNLIHDSNLGTTIKESSGEDKTREVVSTDNDKYTIGCCSATFTKELDFSDLSWINGPCSPSQMLDNRKINNLLVPL